MVIGAVTKGSERFKRTYEMVKRLKCFQRFRVRKGVRTFRKRFWSLLKYLWSFRVRKGAGNLEPLCGSWLNTVRGGVGGENCWDVARGCPRWVSRTGRFFCEWVIGHTSIQSSRRARMLPATYCPDIVCTPLLTRLMELPRYLKRQLCHTSESSTITHGSMYPCNRRH